MVAVAVPESLYISAEAEWSVKTLWEGDDDVPGKAGGVHRIHLILVGNIKETSVLSSVIIHMRNKMQGIEVERRDGEMEREREYGCLPVKVDNCPPQDRAELQLSWLRYLALRSPKIWLMPTKGLGHLEARPE